MVICLERTADGLHAVQLMSLPSQMPSSLVSFKSRLFTFLVPAYPDYTGKEAVKTGVIVVVVI